MPVESLAWPIYDIALTVKGEKSGSIDDALNELDEFPGLIESAKEDFVRRGNVNQLGRLDGGSDVRQADVRRYVLLIEVAARVNFAE